MEQIAAGKGRGAKPFMAAGAKASDPGAIWHSKPAKEPKTTAAGRGNAAILSVRAQNQQSSGHGHAALYRPSALQDPFAAAAGRRLGA